MIYFSEEALEDINRDEILKKPSMALLLKRSSENLPNAIDDVVAQMVYGNLRKPPGDENCPYQKLLLKKDGVEIPGIWAPLNCNSKAMALKWFFPNVSANYKLPEEKPISPHVLVGYDAFKSKDLMELSKKYPEAVMKYGFFTTDVPGASELIAKTIDKFEKRASPLTYDEKIIIQLAKHEQWLEEFCEMGPSYISPDAVQGEEDAKLFFPSSYDIPEDIILEIKKKPKKKIKNKFVAVVEAHENQALQADKETSADVNANEGNSEANLDERDSADEKELEGEEEDEEADDEEGDENLDETDKATSPMVDENGEH